MNTQEQIKANISGLLTEDFQQTTDIIDACKDLYNLKQGTIQIMLNTLVRDGFVEAKDGEIRLLKEFKVTETNKTNASKNPFEDTQVRRRFIPAGPKRTSEFGEEKQIVDGIERTYTRNAFDGEITPLDEEHEIMQQEMIEFKAELRKILWNLDGVNTNAFVIYDPETAEEYGFRNGKVFFRWNGQRTMSKMDELKPFLAEAKELRIKNTEGQ